MNNVKSIVVVLALMLMLTGIGSANLSEGTQAGVSSTPCEASTIITVNGGTETVERYNTYSDAGATATATAPDCTQTPVDVTTDNPVNTNVVGTYTVTYSANGADSKTRTVNVVDTAAPANVDINSIVVGTVTTTSIQLSWTNPTDQDFADIVITVKPTGGNPIDGLNKLTLPGDKANTYTITGLSAGTSYTILLQSADDQEPNHPGNGS